MSAKVSIFQQDQINYHRKLSQMSYLAQTLIKTQNTYNHRLEHLFKNRTICNNLETFHTFVTPKILKKLENLGNLYINLV